MNIKYILFNKEIQVSVLINAGDLMRRVGLGTYLNMLSNIREHGYHETKSTIVTAVPAMRERS